MIYKIPKILSEKKGLLSLGTLKQALVNNSNGITIDFSSCIWSDPQSLLMLSCIVLTYGRDNIIKVNLGDTKNSDHCIFLKFLETQRFLDVFKDFSGHIRLDNLNEWTQVENCIRKLAVTLQMESSLCVGASVISASNIDDKELNRIVENCVNKARASTIPFSIHSNPNAKERLLQKIRKLLQEGILNVFEHAYSDTECGHVGVFARIRHAKPQRPDRMMTWYDLREQEKENIPTIDSFAVASSFNWLELYICDAGDGLFKHTEKWGLPSKVINGIKKSPDKLKRLANYLFRESISRIPPTEREKTGRTGVTGFQHLGSMLSIDGDYSRIYTNGEWIGEMHPWQKGQTSENGIVVGRSQPGHYSTRHSKEKTHEAPGTALAFCVQIKGEMISFELPWHTPTSTERVKILEALQVERHFDYSKWSFHDLLFETHCLPPNAPPAKHAAENSATGVVVLRPPRVLTKKHLSQWIKKIAGTSSLQPEWQCKTFVIAEVSPFQAILLEDLLTNIHLYKQSSARLFIVTKGWDVCCLTKRIGHDKFLQDQIQAKHFFDSKEYGKSSGAAQLALILREFDTMFFWRKITAPTYHNGTVEWPYGGNKSLIMDGYLSFSNALSNPQLRYICMRAVQRCLELLNNYNVISTDSVIESISRELLTKGFNSSKRIIESEQILIGSILVTTGTIEDYSKQKRINAKHAICCFIHKAGECHISAVKNLHFIPALLWNPPTLDTVKDKYCRIKGTPFIARHGDKSVSITLYGRDKDGKIDFEESYYGRSKEQTYQDFERLGCLRLQHTRNGKRHDLLSVNSIRAFENSALEFGDLFQWLFNKIENRIKLSKSKLLLLVYPAHFATDRIVTFLSFNQNTSVLFKSIQVVPVTFFDDATSVPLRVSTTSELEIQKSIDIICHNNTNPVSAVVLDDGVVTGKHLREVEHFLLSKNVDDIHTIALVDRTGVPIYENALKEFAVKNSRYWRHDVPPVGSENSCVLCEAIKRSVNYSKRQSSPTIEARIQEWVESWGVKDIYSEWGAGGCSSSPLPDAKESREVTLGLHIDSNGNENRHTFTIQNSTSLATYIAELTRLTTRADKGLERASRLEGDSPHIVLEVLASQFILFYDKLSYWEKLVRLKRLLNAALKLQFDHPTSSLVPLCASIINRHLAAHFWQDSISNLLKNTVIGNIDVCIMVGMLHTKILSTEYCNLLEPPSTPEERENYIQCGISTGHRSHFRTLFEQIGIRESESHVVPLRDSLKSVVEDGHTLPDTVNRIIRICNLLKRLLEKMDDSFIPTQGELFRPEQDAIKLSGYVGRLTVALSEEDQVEIVKVCSDLRLYIYKDSKCFAKRHRDFFMLKLAKGGFIYDLFNEEDQRQLKERMQLKIVELPEDKKKKFQIDENRYATPIIRCMSLERWNSDHLVYYDPLIRNFVLDLITNAVHVNKIMPNPAVENQDRAHLWWGASIDDKQLNIVLINCFDGLGFLPKLSAGMRGLERVGGRCDFAFRTHQGEDRSESQIAECHIKIPLAEAIVRR
ncbi:MAG: hypothetical protein ABIK45_05265 [Pseudomonadota bacterium]